MRVERLLCRKYYSFAAFRNKSEETHDPFNVIEL